MRFSVQSVASLGLVSPGAATESATPIFLKKTNDFFAHQCHYCHFYSFHSDVTPCNVSPRTFFTCLTSFVHYS